MMIDTHTHVVSSDRARYPLAIEEPSPEEWFVQPALTTEDLLARMDAAGVTGAVLVQAMASHGSDNRYIIDSAKTHPHRCVAVGSVTVRDGSDCAGAVRDLAGAGASGVRIG